MTKILKSADDETHDFTASKVPSQWPIQSRFRPVFSAATGTFDQYVHRMVARVMHQPEVIGRREELLQDRKQGRAQECPGLELDR